MAGGKITIRAGKKITKTSEKYSIYTDRLTLNSNGPIKLTSDQEIVYGVPKQYGHKASCNYTPKSVSLGGKDYYIRRVMDFFDRHKSCMHFPPVYYYGDFRIFGTLTSSEETEVRRARISESRYPNVSREKVEKIRANRARKDALNPKFTKLKKNSFMIYSGTPENSYGYKYCDAFTKLRPNLTEGGKKWLDKTMNLLQELMESGVVNKNYIAKYNEDYNKNNGFYDQYGMLLSENIKNFYTNIELNGGHFQDFAFATHPDAYNPLEMQDLPAHDLVRICLTPELKEWMGPKTWEQAWIVAKNISYTEIGKNTWEKVKKDTKEGAGKLKKYWDEIFKL
ncbi:hypothetical protein ETU08_09740 [Apibacter muscae]|uniref:hypothetical protein n=1 Tax=Apibacter muscae TaxID=2509004 RepID=UPI0011AD22FA|nr:hypothetical protein [Apibacter muscae]TWP27989.1 hypothetical protein ETU08_09740 [Apibacter muscae]